MKRFFSCILALFMLAAFTACGSSQGASASTAPVFRDKFCGKQCAGSTGQ